MSDSAASGTRGALAAARDRLDGLVRQVSSSGDAAAAQSTLDRLAGDLARVTRLLETQHALVQALTDPGVPEDNRAALATRVLAGQVGSEASDLVAGTVRDRFSAPSDLIDTVGELAGEATLASAEQAGALERVEDELFAVSRLVASTPELALALSDPASSPEDKVTLLARLLDGKAHPATIELVTQAVGDTAGRALDRRLEAVVALAAKRRQRLVAVVRVAQPLTSRQAERLAAALSAKAGRSVDLQIQLDPSVIGGVVVELDGEVIDGSVSHRLTAARTRLTHS